MRRCAQCQSNIKGDWQRCPLCESPLETSVPYEPSSFPDVPLQFNRRSLTQLLILLSILFVLVMLVVGFFYRGEILWLQSAIFGIVSMWLAVLILIRKRRNLAKSLLYLLVTLSFLSVYIDYLTAWTRWSLTYAIPIICSSVLVAMFITARFTRLKAGDYVLYWGAAEILSLTPIIFLLLGWTTNRVPSLISIGLGFVMLIIMLITKGNVIWSEIKKRTFI